MKWKEVFRPNKISISLFIILFIILSFFFFMLPATTCESLFLSEKFELNILWFLPLDVADTTMRIVNQEYEKCIVIAPIIFIVLFAVIAYIIASLIVYGYNKQRYKRGHK